MCWCGQIGCDGFHVDPALTEPLRLDPPPLDPSSLAHKAVEEMQEKLVAAERKHLADQANPNCGRCRFFYEFAERQAGSCHRRAPVVGNEAWPFVIAGNWCGEFEPRPEAA
jgi:hypothetical protein